MIKYEQLHRWYSSTIYQFFILCLKRQRSLLFYKINHHFLDNQNDETQHCCGLKHQWISSKNTAYAMAFPLNDCVLSPGLNGRIYCNKGGKNLHCRLPQLTKRLSDALRLCSGFNVSTAIASIVRRGEGRKKKEEKKMAVPVCDYAALCVTDQQLPGFTRAGWKQEGLGSFSISALCWRENNGEAEGELMYTVCWRWSRFYVTQTPSAATIA